MKKKQLDAYSWILTASILLIGFLMMQFELVDYGYTFFMIFPLFLGFSIGLLFKKGIHILYLTLGLVAGCCALILFGIEGFVCVLMLLPIFLGFITIGYFVGKRLRFKTDKKSTKAFVSLLPLLVLLSIGNLELVIDLEPEIIEIETSVTLPYAPELLFDGVKSMKKLDGEQPFLMKLGLPTPIRCELEANEVGALRHCIFENGEITAQLTQYEKGEVLEMDVVDYTLTGRHWFKFIDAKYLFERVNDQNTTITRISSYKSTLKPRWYWQPLEKIGIAQEHTFVLNSLKKNIEEQYSE